MKKNTVKNRIIVVLSVLLVVAMLSFAFTEARYSEESTPENHTGELDYTLANQVTIYNTQQFFAAVENGYSNIKIADSVSNPFLISGSADVTADLIMDLNGHEIQRNNRAPMLTVTEGVKMIVTDTSKTQTGSFYNPVGSVLAVDGGVLTVMSNKFESGPRDNEYFKNSLPSSTSGVTYIGGTIDDANTSTVNPLVHKKNGEKYEGDSSIKGAPIILPYVRESEQGAVVGNSKYFVNGNIYFDQIPANYTGNLITEDSYFYFTIDDQNVSTASIMPSEASANYYYTYYIQNTSTSGTPVYVYAGTTHMSETYIEVRVYVYNNVIASARNEVEPYKSSASNFAAIKMKRGSMHARGGEFYSYFGVETSSCIYADEGNLAVYDGSYTALKEGVGIVCNYKQPDSVFTISGGNFKSYKGDTIKMLDGEMTINGGTFVKDSTAYADDKIGSVVNNAGINLIDGTMKLNSTTEQINFYLAGYNMAGILCGVEAKIVALGVNFMFGTTDGENGVKGGKNTGIMSEGGDITVDNCLFIQTGKDSFGIYANDKSTSAESNTIDVLSTIFSMKGENSVGVYSKGGTINIGEPSDMYTPDNKSNATNAAGEVVEGVSIDNYTIFYLDHVANCYGVYVDREDMSTLSRATDTKINIYSGQFFIGCGKAKDTETETIFYASKEIPDAPRDEVLDDGKTTYEAYTDIFCTNQIKRKDVEEGERVWAAGVYVNDPTAYVNLGKLRMIIGGYYSAGVFAESGNVDSLYDETLDRQFNNGQKTAENKIPTAVFFIGTTARGYKNGGCVRPDATEKSKKWAYLYKRAEDYKQTKDFRTLYDRIDPVESSDNYGIAAKGGQITLGRIYVNVRSQYSRGIFASANATTGETSQVTIKNCMANIDCMDFDPSRNEYVLPDALTTTPITVRDGNLAIYDADIRTNSAGIIINNGKLEFIGNIKFEAINASAVYMTSTMASSGGTDGLHNDFTIGVNAKASIFCNIREVSDDDLTEPIPLKMKNVHDRTAPNSHLISKNGINIKGGSFTCDGELDIDFHGLNNKNQESYDPYNMTLSSAALNVEKLTDGDTPAVNLWHSHITVGKAVYGKGESFFDCVTDISKSNGGGGVSVKGGIVRLGKKDNSFYQDPTQKGYQALHGESKIHDRYHDLITIQTLGYARYDNLLGSYTNWNYYVSQTGGPGIKVESGEIIVRYGNYYAAQGNGILVVGGKATVQNGEFRGKNLAWNRGEGDSTGSGLGSYYGFMLRGGGTLIIEDGLFEGFNGGAFVTGSKAEVDGVQKVNTATVTINGGTFEDMPERRHERFTTNGFSVGPFSNVTIGMENPTAGYDAPKIRGLACGIAVENNGSFGSDSYCHDVTIIIQGGAIIRAMKGGRPDTVNAIWQGNTNATVKLRDCNLRQQNFKLIWDENGNIIGFETDENGNIIDDTALADRIINAGSRTWGDFVDEGYTIIGYTALTDEVGTVIERTESINTYKYYKVVISKKAA